MSQDDSGIASVVIRLVDQGERNRIVTFLTAERGRVAAIARGARGKSRRFGGHLDLFHRGEAVVTRRGRSGLGTLQRFDVKQPYEGIRQDIVKFALASFLVELVAYTTVDDAGEPAQFALLVQLLGELAESETSVRRDLLLSFQLRWFYLLGVLPELTPEGLVEAELRPMSADALTLAQAWFDREDIGAPEHGPLAEVGHLTRMLRTRVLSRPLASESFLRQVLRAEEARG